MTTKGAPRSRRLLQDTSTFIAPSVVYNVVVGGTGSTTLIVDICLADYDSTLALVDPAALTQLTFNDNSTACLAKVRGPLLIVTALFPFGPLHCSLFLDRFLLGSSSGSFRPHQTSSYYGGSWIAYNVTAGYNYAVVVSGASATAQGGFNAIYTATNGANVTATEAAIPPNSNTFVNNASIGTPALYAGSTNFSTASAACR